MKLGRVTFNTHLVLRSTFSLGMVTLVALYTGGSVPDEFRRYIVTQQDTSSESLQAAVDRQVDDGWRTVGTYVVDQDLLSALTGRERAIIRAAYKQEITQANAETTIRQSIRIPLLPGPVVVADAGPTEKRIVAEAPADVAAKPAARVEATPAANSAQPSALSEDIATIEALKTALQDLKKEGITAGRYRNDIADK